MALVPEVVAVPAGATPAPRTAANGDTVVPNDHVQLVVNNASGASVTVTVVGVQPCSHGVVHDLAVAVPAGQTRHIGPITARFANATTGLAVVNYSATTSVNVHTTRA